MFYIYLWLREDDTPYYAGKGKGGRAYTSKGHGVHCPKEKERIVIYPAESEASAFETEIALIWYYGRKDLGFGCLRNLTDGGEGGTGHKRGHKDSEETKKKKSESRKGIKYSEITIQRMREAHQGEVHSAEHSYKQGSSNRGKHLSKEHKANIGKANSETQRKLWADPKLKAAMLLKRKISREKHIGDYNV